jgi:hypothetical protein
VGDDRRPQRVEGAAPAVVVEALEHPAEKPEHEPIGVLGVVAEPHPGARTVDLDIGEPGGAEDAADPIRVSE